MTLNCGPVYTVTFRLATSAEDWERIEPRVHSKDLFPILTRAYVINALKRFALFIQILDGRFILSCKLQVKPQESSHQYTNNTVHDKGKDDEDIVA